MSDNDDAQEQARRQGQGHVHTTIVDEKELEGQGVPPPPAGVELPSVDGQITLDDDDAGVCRFATKDEIRDLYVDNPVTASPVQPDVWTLDVDNQSVTFTYANGTEYTVQVGQINWDPGPGASRYRKYGNIVYPTDEGGNVLSNSVTMPRLAHVRVWLHDQVREIAAERLEMAELVHAFTEIIAKTSGLDGIH
jgi:hypothetical protein